MYCEGKSLCDEPITTFEDFYRMCTFLTVWDLGRPGTEVICSTVTDVPENLNCTLAYEVPHKNTRSTSVLFLRSYRHGLTFSDASWVKAN